MSGHWRWAILVIVAGVTGTVSALEDDPSLIAAVSEALRLGRGEQALRLLPSDSTFSQTALLRSQALAQVNGYQAGLAALAVPGAEQSPQQREAWLAQWPQSLRWQVADQLGSWCQQKGRADSLYWWTLAIDHGAPPSRVHELLLLICEAAAAQDRWSVVDAAAQTLWLRGAPWALRAAGGEWYAHALSQEDSEAALQHVQGMLVHPQLTKPQHRRLALLAVRLALPQEPARALTIAGRACRLLAEEAGELPMWRALALARLDPARGAEELASLPQALADNPRVRAEQTRLAQQQTLALSPEQALSRAAAAVALLEWQRAEKLLEPLLDQDPQAVVLWLQLPQRDIRQLVDRPTARQPTAGIPLLAALYDAGHYSALWRVSEQLLLNEDISVDQRLTVLDWALQVVDEQAPARRETLLKQARLLAREHRVVGRAWAELAHSQARTGDAAAAQTWRQALRYTPPQSNLAPTVAIQVMKHILLGLPSWQAQKDVPAPMREYGPRLQRIYVAHTGADDQQIAWLWAQCLALLGDQQQARAVLQELLPQVSAARRQRIQEVLQHKLGSE